MHTVETAICTVITLLLLVQIVLSGQMTYLQTRETAEREAASCVFRIETSGLYESEDSIVGKPGMPAVRTSPVKLVYLTGAAREALEPLTAWLKQVLQP